jgi:hypothetical protein
MNSDELKQKLKQLYTEFEIKKKYVIQEYCNANNSYKIGEKFTDHIGTILIESIAYSYGDKPCCIYVGSELKKDGTLTKRMSKRQAWQSNDVNKQ